MMRSCRQWVSLLLVCGVAGSPISLAGCTPSVIDGGFDSPMSASRLYAIERSAREGNTSSIRHIIEQLESDDPAVRMMAIGALERLTGRTYGYDYGDPLLERRAAIRRWRDAYQSGALDERLQEPNGVTAQDAESSSNRLREGATDG